MLAMIGAIISAKLKFIEHSVGMPRLKSAIPLSTAPVGSVRVGISGFGKLRSRQTGCLSALVRLSGSGMSIVLIDWP